MHRSAKYLDSKICIKGPMDTAGDRRADRRGDVGEGPMKAEEACPAKGRYFMKDVNASRKERTTNDGISRVVE